VLLGITGKCRYRPYREDMKPVQVVGAAALGAVVGVLLAALWWTARDRAAVCLGGCSASEKNLPPGDLTLAAGALAGAALAVVVVLAFVRLRRQR